MELVRGLYIRAYFIVMALYVFFDKGLAYSFLVEALWIGGIVLLIAFRKKVNLIYNRTTKLLYVFLLITFIYIIRGAFSYPILDVIRDAFIFQYAWFAIIVMMLQEEQDYIWEKIKVIYKWFPIIAFCIFFAQFFIPFLEQLSLFGGIPILLYKYGDMGVQLLISALLMMLYPDMHTKKWKMLLGFFIVLDFLIVSAYSRSGAISFLIGIFCFIYFNKDAILKASTLKWLKYIPLLLIIIIPLYLNLEVGENFQGRSIGIEQLIDNYSFIIGATTNATSENNIVWRLIWWAKILDYSFSFPHFFIGKGLGMSLAASDGIATTDETLRSPHNFHLNIMARFGVLYFMIWIYWLIQILKPLFQKKLTKERLLITVVLLGFILNASFDVYLEGPMGAFPFWTWVGLLFITTDNPVLENA